MGRTLKAPTSSISWSSKSKGQLVTKVLVAQEAERRRVSREMHDDLAQKVALLEFQIEAMKQRLGAEPRIRRELDSLRSCVAMLADDLHRICYQLHPVILDRLGLVRGIEYLCCEQTRTSSVNAEFVHGQISEKLPADISLCLYRVAQEALSNVAKHSGSSAAVVELNRFGKGLRLVVSDFGRGFGSPDGNSRPGLGLRFIDERVRLLGGRCMIRSAPGKGTRISAYLPLAASDAAANPAAIGAAN